MKQYDLAIANLGKILLIVGLMIAWVPIMTYVIYLIDLDFLRIHTLISIFLILILPFGLFMLIIFSQRKKDVLRLTSYGIESDNHGIIKWLDIDMCSWETSRGTYAIYLKLRTNKWLSIVPSSIWKNYSEKVNDLRELYDEINQIRNNLPESDRFRMYEGRITNWIYIVTFGLLVIIFLARFIYNLITK
jgi:hypothetical protein